MSETRTGRTQQGLSLMGVILTLVIVAVGAVLLRAKLNTLFGAGPVEGPPPGTVVDVGDHPHDPVLLTWGATHGDGIKPVAAPELSLRLRYTDLSRWRSDFRKTNRLNSRRSTGPDGISLEILVPNAQSFSPAPLDTICPPGDAPFVHCVSGGVRLSLYRTRRHTQAEKILVGREPVPSFDEQPLAQRPRASLVAMWVRDQGTQRRIAGWACPDDLHADSRLPRLMDPLRNIHPDPRLRCFTPQKWWEQKWPALAGYEQIPVFVKCHADDCSAHFRFKGRTVDLDYLRTWPRPEDEDEPLPATPLMLLVAAWETLERARSDAAQGPPAPLAELPEAQVQAQVCAALVGEGRRWLGRSGFMEKDARKAWRRRWAPCEKAARLSIDLARHDSEAAVAVLGGVAQNLLSVDEELPGVVSAWLRSLEAGGQGDSRAMFDAIVVGLRLARGGSGLAEHKPRIEHAWHLARSLQPPVPLDQAEQVVGALAQLAFWPERDDAAREKVYGEWVAMVDARDASLARRLHARVLYADQLQHTRSVDALRPVAEQMHNLVVSAPRFALQLGSEQDRAMLSGAAFTAAFNFRILAFLEHEFEGNGRLMLEVIERLEKEFGRESAIVKGARHHYQEVIDRTPAGRGPIGGGHLGG